MGLSDYRDDIQIYRAIAVAAVVLYHFGVPGFQSGFLGVDIFFVISGYLMWRLHDGSALNFYRRRARRLLPAYFAATAASLIAGFWITLPSEYGQLAEQAIYAATFTSNVGYWAQNSYFAKQDFNPLLHLWSLAVEIQFYLLFPLLAWVCKGRRWLLVAITAASLALCLIILTISPKTSFFMLPARLWEFGLGMLAASSVRPLSASFALPASAAMLLIPLIPLEPESISVIAGHPGLAALAIALATAVALMSGLPAKVVASAPGRLAQRLGDVSYSLYLAHWPALVLLHYQPFRGTIINDGTLGSLAAAAGLTAVGTALLYQLFERPGQRLFTAPRAVAVGAALAALALLLPSIQLARYPREQRLIFAALEDRAAYRCGKLVRIMEPGAEFCRLGGGPQAVMLIGDSHADALKNSFAKAASSAGYATIFPVANDPLLTPSLDAKWLRENAGDVEAIYLHYASLNLMQPSVLAAARELVGSGHRVVLIAPVPEYSRGVPEMLFYGVKDRTTAEAYAQTWEPALAEFRRAGVEVVPIAKVLCDPVCAIADREDRALYFDGGHLTLTGAKVLEPILSRHLPSE